MKKWIIFTLLMVILSGCKESTNEEIYYKLHKKIVGIQSYSCIAQIEACGNKSMKKYTVKHYFKSPSYYKIQVLDPENIKGKVTIYDKDKVIIHHPRIKDKVTFSYKGKENRYLFIGDFAKNILQNEKINISSSKEFLILETSIPDTSIYFDKQKLYIDKKTLKPNKMEIIDVNGKKRFMVAYKEFRYNGE